MNHLEQLVAEWHEYQGYFVRRNVLVGKRPGGGWECELDVIAFHPVERRLRHIEASWDAHSWEKREARYQKKFDAGKKHIPQMFNGLDVPTEIEQIALFGMGGSVPGRSLGGGRVMHVSDLLVEITGRLRGLRIEKSAVPEQFPLLRTIQLMCQHDRPPL